MVAYGRFGVTLAVPVLTFAVLPLLAQAATGTVWDIVQTGVAVAVLVWVVLGFQRGWWSSPEAYRQQLEAQSASHRTEIERIERQHRAEMERVSELHAGSIDRLRDDLDGERRDAEQALAALTAYRERMDSQVVPTLIRATDTLVRFADRIESRRAD